MTGTKLATVFISYDESTNYWTDGKKVYFRGYEIRGADIHSFEQFPGCWAKDKNRCYLTSSKLKNADPSSFKVLNYSYAMDQSNVWTMGGRIHEADVETFEVCDDGKQSLGTSFKKLNSGKTAWYELLVPYGFARDKNNVYYYDYQGKTKIVKKAVTSSFVSCNDNYFGYDEKTVFCGASALPKANPATWRKLKDDYYYSRDGNRIYYFNRLIKDADAGSFDVVAIPPVTGNPWQLAKDKNHFYSNDHIISKDQFDEMVSKVSVHNQKMEELWKSSGNNQ